MDADGRDDRFARSRLLTTTALFGLVAGRSLDPAAAF